MLSKFEVNSFYCAKANTLETQATVKVPTQN